MIPCFVISLPDCTDRRDAIRARLDRLGVAFEFLDAVDGRQGLPPEYEGQIDRVATREAGRILADAEYGCALSHINAYRRIVIEAIPYALILEDDALPQPALADFLTGRHHQDAEMTQFYIGSNPYVRRRRAKTILPGHTSYVLTPIMQGGTVGHVLSGSAARFILTNALPVIDGADWPACAHDILVRRQWRTVHSLLVSHSPRCAQEAGQSLIITHSLWSPDQIAAQRQWMQRVRGLPRKLLYKRLPRKRSKDL